MSGLGQGGVYSHGDPTAYEQFMLELINEARANPAAQADRLGIGLNDGLEAARIGTEAKQPLAFHPLLIQAARAHSDWMLSTDVFSHSGAGGSTPSERAKAAGYSFGVGENIAYRSTTGVLNANVAVQANHDGLFKSPGHRVNLMERGYSVVGLGVREGEFEGWSAQMVSQSFSAGGASEDSGPFLLGVVFDDKNLNGRYDPGEGLEGVRVDPDYGGYTAVTSASGGYAIPLPPQQTQVETVRLPLALQSATWDEVRPYDEAYRRTMIEEAPWMVLRISWRGSAIGGATTSSARIKKPVRVHYKLEGTDGAYYSRTMVAAENVKVDFLLQDPPIALQGGNVLASSTTDGIGNGGTEKAVKRGKKSKSPNLGKSKAAKKKSSAKKPKKSKGGRKDKSSGRSKGSKKKKVATP